MVGQVIPEYYHGCYDVEPLEHPERFAQVNWWTVAEDKARIIGHFSNTAVQASEYGLANLPVQEAKIKYQQNVQ